MSKNFIFIIALIIVAAGIYTFAVSRQKSQTGVCINNLRQIDVSFNKQPVQLLDPAAPSNSIAADVDRLWRPSFKIDWEPIVDRVVVCGDRAVPILTNRLADRDEGTHQYLLICLCRINTDVSLKPVREILGDYSLDEEIRTNRMSHERGIYAGYDDKMNAIREYPTNHETKILPQLIHYSDYSYSGISFWACDRLRKMIHREPTVVGVMIASLDDNREEFSLNLGDILNRELGNPFRWPPGSVSDTPQNSTARYNSFWHDWWEQNKAKYMSDSLSNLVPPAIH